MSATRSRTENWSRSLQQLCERNGALEITLPHNMDNCNTDGSKSGDNACDLIWRVRILKLTDDSIYVEEPMALGQTIRLRDGAQLVGIIAIGQNRWMFRTKIVGREPVELSAGRRIVALRLVMPEGVERCQRRNFYRASTVGLSLPPVECYPLLDPATAVVAETANRLKIQDMQDRAVVGRIESAAAPDRDVLPEVGPLFKAVLMNVGGGGVGLIVEPGEEGGLESCRTFWLRVDLRPEIPMPICVTARLKHTHIDSTRRVYVGMAFDFGFNPEHQAFVVDQLCRFVAQVQRDQLRRAQAG